MSDYEDDSDFDANSVSCPSVASAYGSDFEHLSESSALEEDHQPSVIPDIPLSQHQTETIPTEQMETQDDITKAPSDPYLSDFDHSDDASSSHDILAVDPEPIDPVSNSTSESVHHSSSKDLSLESSNSKNKTRKSYGTTLELLDNSSDSHIDSPLNSSHNSGDISVGDEPSSTQNSTLSPLPLPLETPSNPPLTSKVNSSRSPRFSTKLTTNALLATPPVSLKSLEHLSPRSSDDVNFFDEDALTARVRPRVPQGITNKEKPQHKHTGSLPKPNVSSSRPTPSSHRPLRPSTRASRKSIQHSGRLLSTNNHQAPAKPSWNSRFSTSYTPYDSLLDPYNKWALSKTCRSVIKKTRLPELDVGKLHLVRERIRECDCSIKFDGLYQKVVSWSVKSELCRSLPDSVQNVLTFEDFSDDDVMKAMSALSSRLKSLWNDLAVPSVYRDCVSSFCNNSVENIKILSGEVQKLEMARSFAIRICQLIMQLTKQNGTETSDEVRSKILSNFGKLKNLAPWVKDFCVGGIHYNEVSNKTSVSRSNSVLNSLITEPVRMSITKLKGKKCKI
ncbi:hypothetical protein GEMRC1_012410 [Eukaryota sp. GEM-RC1]